METVIPIQYKLRMKPDLLNFTFSATVEIQVRASYAVGEISLNALDLSVDVCAVDEAGQWRSCEFDMDAAEETLRVLLPDERSDDICLQIRYRGIINDKMAGFYRSRYVVDGKERYIAVTQFQESDARRALPCMDYPAAKAVFDITMVVDEDLTALSNCDIVEETFDGNGKKQVRFGKTPKMSTYLVFFGVGDFRITEDTTDRRVRGVTLPGMTPYAKYGIKFGRMALSYCEKYYGIPYPLPKLDHIAIPDFAFGAMENWGAMTFRENLLLHYPGVTSRLGESRICEVIAHEIAHQWFGNLVTPSDWKYLWLNESFATYFGYGVVDCYHPEWQTWDHFLLGQTQSALNRDGLRETFPIEIPGGEHVVINTSTAPIIYSKGGSILRQVEAFIGPEDFKEGLRLYLKQHEYGCAESHHLWESLEAASNKPVTAMMKSWVEQPGHPVITASRKGNHLALSQKRFTFLPEDFSQKWMIPVTVTFFSATGEKTELTLIFDTDETRVPLGEEVAAYKINTRQNGFYRVCYKDPDNLQKLGKQVEEKNLSPEDRWGLEQDHFALVKAGMASVESYLSFLSHYSDEKAFLPLMSIADNLHQAYLIVKSGLKEKIARSGRRIAEQVLSDLGFEPVEGESHAVAVLRDQILWQAVLYGSPIADEFARKKFNELSSGASIHPDIKKSVLQTGAFRGDLDTFAWFTDRIKQAVSEHDRMNFLASLGCFSDPVLIEKTQQYLLTEVPDRNRFIPVAALCQNPQAIPLMWRWYLSHRDELEQSHPLLYERVIASIVPVCGLERVDEVRSFFDDYIKKHRMLTDVIRLSLERLKINHRMRDAN